MDIQPERAGLGEWRGYAIAVAEGRHGRGLAADHEDGRFVRGGAGHPELRLVLPEKRDVYQLADGKGQFHFAPVNTGSVEAPKAAATAGGWVWARRKP